VRGCYKILCQKNASISRRTRHTHAGTTQDCAGGVTCNPRTLHFHTRSKNINCCTKVGERSSSICCAIDCSDSDRGWRRRGRIIQCILLFHVSLIILHVLKTDIFVPCSNYADHASSCRRSNGRVQSRGFRASDRHINDCFPGKTSGCCICRSFSTSA
jgi:hypothetical protein